MVVSQRDLARFVQIGLAAVLACGIAYTVVFADSPRARSGVRSTNPAIAGLLDQAVQRSHTFRQLVEQIGQTDGIVYIEHGKCGHGVHACLLMSITATPEFRLLRVFVDITFVKTLNDAADLIGSLGHELRHALEVLTDASITSTTQMYFFYAREFPTSQRSFETRAAIDAGNQVRKELKAVGWTFRPL